MEYSGMRASQLELVGMSSKIIILKEFAGAGAANTQQKGWQNMKIEFTDTQYRFEHGHAPKGRGRWIFQFEGQEYWAKGCQTLTEAKKEVKEYIKKIAPKDYIGTVYVNIAP